MSPSGVDTSLVAVGTPIDLTNCDREPIHTPGSIQPRGVLLAVRESDLRCTQISTNVADLVGMQAADAVGRALADIVGHDAATAIERATAVFGGDLRERNPVEVVVRGKPYDAVLHRAVGGILIVELEAATGPRPFSFPNTYLAVRGVVSELNRTIDLGRLYEITADAVQKLTGFDRVMIYRYDDDFNGEVVAERKLGHLEPFLGLHYPASDIPAQARALYERSWIRLISDVDYEPVALTPTFDPHSGEPLDLSLATLRSVSPIHLEYLHNMGVRASMSISLLRHGALWGLIACHHYSDAHAPPYGVRAAAEFLGATLSLRLVDRADEIDLRARLDSAGTLAKLTAATLNENGSIVTALLGAPNLLDLIPADGVAIAAEGHTGTIGTVPDPAIVHAILAWARESGEDIAVTDSLPLTAPELRVPVDLACGVLAIPLPENQYLIWFRTEQVQDVDWGGDPHTKTTQNGPSNTRLSPRKSFDMWRETIKLRSRAWSTAHKDLANELRRHVVETLYSRSQHDLRLAEVLQRSLLPATLPTVPGWQLSSHYEIAEGGQIGGDWYDAFLVSDRTLAVVLGDVAGHGIAAAGIMAQLRNVLRGHLLDTASPATSLEKTNRFATEVLTGAYATAVVACIDTQTGHVRAASAGHLTPYLTSASSTAPAPIITSPPLGVASTVFRDQQFVLAPGDGLVLYSDGVIERRDDDLSQSIARLGATLDRHDPEATATEVFTAVTTPHPFDDATVLAIHRSR
jgi:two-component system, chemotaxis family, sensor kinase Cph1